MKISAATLPFLILAAALGPPALASLWSRSSGNGGKHPDDCCLPYPLRMECGSVQDYYLTGSECSQRAVVFIFKRGLKICTYANSETAKDCMEDVDLEKKQRKLLAEKKLQ